MVETIHRNSLKPGYRLHWYLFKKILGHGGFGITYLAQDINLNKAVAIKEYLPIDLAIRERDLTVQPITGDHAQNYQWGLERFITEAQTLSRFSHPNIVRVYSVFEENNTAYMVMEYEHGESLQNILNRRKTLEEPELLSILLPIIDGLDLVHHAGFIHRDIKPANIFIRQDGTPVLLDFGSARQAMGTQTKTLTSLVSPGYAPFEQYYSKSEKQGPWTDIYALSATIYRCILGSTPMNSIDRSEAILKNQKDNFITARKIGKKRYSKALLNAIDQGLQFKSEDRPQTIAEWKKEFGNIKTSKFKNNLRLTESILTHRQKSTVKAGSEHTQAVLLQSVQKKKKPLPWLGIMVGSLTIMGVSLLLWANKNNISINMGLRNDLDSQADIISEVRREPKTEEITPNVNTPDNTISELLEQAEKALKEERFLEPPDNNAYVYYQQIIELEPDNVDAQNGIETIVNRLIGIAVENINDDEINASAKILQKVQEIAPSNKKLVEAKQLLQEKIEKNKQLAEEKRARLEQARKETELQQKIKKLLKQADENIQALRLTTPEGINAYDKYKQIMTLSPGNLEAKRGIQKIADKYVELANDAINRGAYNNATNLLDKASNISPGAENIQLAIEKIEFVKKQEEKRLAEEQKRMEEARRTAEKQRTKEQASIEVMKENEEKQILAETITNTDKTKQGDIAEPVKENVAIFTSGMLNTYKQFKLDEEELTRHVEQIFNQIGFNVIDKNTYNSIKDMKVEMAFRARHSEGAMWDWTATITILKAGSKIWEREYFHNPAAQIRNLELANAKYISFVEEFISQYK